MGNVLTIIYDAISTVLGWMFIVVVTIYIGVYLGCNIFHGELFGLSSATGFLVLTPLMWLVYPQVLLGFAITVMSIYMPLIYETGWSKINAAASNVAAWSIIAYTVTKDWTG
jgi:hypothetical protein